LNSPLIVKTLILWKSYYIWFITAFNYSSQRANEITSSTLQARITGNKLTGLAKVRFDSQLVKTNRALISYAGQLAQDNLLPIHLPDKIQKPKWAKPKKIYDKASARSLTGAEAVEKAADKAENSSKISGKQVARTNTPEDNSKDISNIPPLADKSQEGTTIALAIRTPEHLKGPPELIPALISEPQGTPEAQVEPPTSTAPARIEGGPRKRRRVPNMLYRDSQYKLD